MKWDNDVFRNVLMEFEAEQDWLVIPEYTGSSDADDRRKEGHLRLLCDAGFMTPVREDTFRLTNAGHDFLEAMRDEGIWTRTKQVVAETGGNATLEIVKQLAVGFLKKKIRDHTDFDF